MYSQRYVWSSERIAVSWGLASLRVLTDSCTHATRVAPYRNVLHSLPRAESCVHLDISSTHKTDGSFVNCAYDSCSLRSNFGLCLFRASFPIISPPPSFEQSPQFLNNRIMLECTLPDAVVNKMVHVRQLFKMTQPPAIHAIILMNSPPTYSAF